MSEDEKHEQRTVTLESSSDYAAWRLSNATNLLGKDLLGYVIGTVDFDLTDVKLDVKEKRNVAKAFAAVIRSWGDTITASLPSNIKDPFDPKPVALWKHLKATYSAQNGARTAALLQEVLGMIIQDGENPTPFIG
jgi:hypothetical protein